MLKFFAQTVETTRKTINLYLHTKMLVEFSKLTGSVDIIVLGDIFAQTVEQLPTKWSTNTNKKQFSNFNLLAIVFVYRLTFFAQTAQTITQNNVGRNFHYHMLGR